MINKALVLASEAFGLKHFEFSSRSYRVGGATSMKAKGGDEVRSLICETGGWDPRARNDSFILEIPLWQPMLHLSVGHQIES